VTSEGKPRVAVIIPCLDDGATLQETVNSVQQQDEEVELVVVDDGSTEPSTLRAFDQLKAAGVKVVHQENRGLADARMTGVAATTAPFVFPLDADDVLARGSLRVLADALDCDPESALVWGDYRTFGDRSYVQNTANSLDAWQLTYQNDLPGLAMVRRDALIGAGGWTLGGGYEDWDLWLTLAERGYQGRRLPLVVFDYRLHGTRMLRDSAKRHGAIYWQLRARHARLYAKRRALWRRSGAPLLLRLSLPLVELLPLSRNRKRQLGGLACHLAHRRGFGTLMQRAR
jgi:glycosyltransferase involved in cell wall biosynthesis